MSDIEEILKERPCANGDPSDHARVSQQLKELLKEQPPFQGLKPFQKEALEMITHLERTAGPSGNPDHHDCWGPQL